MTSTPAQNTSTITVTAHLCPLTLGLSSTKMPAAPFVITHYRPSAWYSHTVSPYIH